MCNVAYLLIGLAARGKKAQMYRKTEKGFAPDGFRVVI